MSVVEYNQPADHAVKSAGQDGLAAGQPVGIGVPATIIFGLGVVLTILWTGLLILVAGRLFGFW
jgi:hypothetical protein